MSERTPLTPDRVRQNLYADIVTSLAPPFMLQDIVAAWEADRARLATLEARVAALVPLAEAVVDEDDGFAPNLPVATYATARAALAAIAAETTTTGGQGDGE